MTRHVYGTGAQNGRLGNSAITRRSLLRAGAASVAATGLIGTASGGPTEPAHGPVPDRSVPEAIEGFTIRPLTPLRLPTSLTFGPDGDLYATSIPRTGYEPSAANQVGAGRVDRVRIRRTATGPIATDVGAVVSGLNVPLGVVMDGSDLYVTDKHSNQAAGRENGVVYRRTDAGATTPVVDGLPVGLHDTNHVEIGPDGRLYIANGSATCNGTAPTLSRQEVAPYNGSFLAVTPGDVSGSPAVLEWTDENGDPIESATSPPRVNTAIATHDVNDDFNSTVEVMAHGFRNIFGIAFGPDGTAYTGMNGSQDPASQDVFYRLDAWGEDDPRATAEFGPDYGYPFVFNRTSADNPGEGGETENIELRPNAVYDDVSGAPTDPAANDYVAGDGLIGWHVCSVGLDFPTTGPFGFPTEMHSDAFLGECGAYQANNIVDRTAASKDTRNTGHKVTHVILDDAGQPKDFRNFVSGLGTPTDVQFGPEGAMYIADLDFGVYVVQPTAAASLSES